VLLSACVSKGGAEGKELAEIGQVLVQAGAIAFSRNGTAPRSTTSELMRRGLRVLVACSTSRVLNHARGPGELTPTAEVMQRKASSSLVLQGCRGMAGLRPEDAMTARDIRPGRFPPADEFTSCTSLERPAASKLIRRAKSRGKFGSRPKSARHHFSLTDESLRSFDANFKMMPRRCGAAPRTVEDLYCRNWRTAQSTAIGDQTMPRTPAEEEGCASLDQGSLRHRRTGNGPSGWVADQASSKPGPFSIGRRRWAKK